MVARLASIAKWHQKVAGSSPAVVIFSKYLSWVRIGYGHLFFAKMRFRLVGTSSTFFLRIIWSNIVLPMFP